MNPNERQVGGQHYASEYQHWDWCIDTGLGYLESAATKYVSRWPEKNGHQDIRKAIHYLEKAQEARTQGRYSNKSCSGNGPGSMQKALDMTTRFCRANQLGPLESKFMEIVVAWRWVEDLSEAIGIANHIIATSEDVQGQAKGGAAMVAPGNPSKPVSDALRTPPGPGDHYHNPKPVGWSPGEHPSPFGYDAKDELGSCSHCAGTGIIFEQDCPVCQGTGHE
jgi:hypothetical protein